MDNLTHSLVGALIGQAGLKRKTGLAMPALIIGANLPDIDATCVVYGLESLTMRRGLTHGPIAWVLLPLALAAILYGWDRWQARRGTRPEGRLPVRFGQLYLIALIACLTHPALDWMNSYGIRLLEPFSSRWFYGDALFIVDVWLWAGLGFAVWRSLRLERKQRHFEGTAQVALGALLLYAGFNAGSSALDKELNSDSEILIPNPVPFAFWERQRIWGDGDGLWQVEEEELGDIPLSQCDLDAVRRADPRVDAFLFWSRAPYVTRAESGWMLGDARFATRSGGLGGFFVALPEAACVSG